LSSIKILLPNNKSTKHEVFYFHFDVLSFQI
jgi:hypothetical protein